LNHKKRVGILMRSFARTPDKTDETVQRIMKAVKEIVWFEGTDWSVSLILSVIPVDRSYKDSDSGDLSGAVRLAWLKYRQSLSGPEHVWPPKADFMVHEVSTDLFVGAQNFALGLFASSHVDVMVTLAPSAARYFDRDTAEDVMSALKAGVRVVGISIPEDGIDELVYRGTLGGPIVAWDLKSLVGVGGFDERAAQPRIGEENPNAGCEEIYPLVRIIKKYGACMAPVQTQARVERRKLEGEDLARHEKQIATKTEHQMAHARVLGVEDLDFFARAVMLGCQVMPIVE